MKRLPSTSSRTPPPARAAKTGITVPTPSATAAVRRASSSWDFGPGMAVTTRRSCGSALMGCSWGWGEADARCLLSLLLSFAG